MTELEYITDLELRLAALQEKLKGKDRTLCKRLTSCSAAMPCA